MGEADIISFGPFTLDPRREALTRDGAQLPVGHRGVVLLKALLDANGETVSKADLMEQAWPGTVVEEGNLTVQIAGLRKALGRTNITLSALPCTSFAVCPPHSLSRETTC